MPFKCSPWWLRAMVWAAVLGMLAAVLVPNQPRGFSAYLSDQGPMPKGGDFLHYYFAGEAAAAGEHVYESYTGGYLYPPLLAAVLKPTVPLGIDRAALVWYWSNVVLVGAAGLWAAWFMRRRVLPRDEPAVLEFGLLLGLAIGLDLIKRQAAFAQTDGLVLAGMVLLLPGLVVRRAGWRALVLAAVGMGLAVNIKYMAVGVVPYLLVTRRWGLAGASVGGAVAVALSTAFVFGWERNLEYLAASAGGLLRVVGLEGPTYGGFDPHPITWINSVSVTSAFARLGEQTGLGTILLIAGCGVVFVAWLSAAAWLYRRNGLGLFARVLRPRRALPEAWVARVGVLEFMSVLGAIAVFSPQTTKRHMFPMLVAVALAGMLAVSRTGRPARLWSLAALGVFAGGMYLPPGSVTPESWADGWRWIGGAGWCAMAFSVALLASGLADGRRDRLRAGEE